MILVLILLVLTGCTNWAAVQEDNSPGGGSESAGAAESVAAGREETVYAGEEVLPAQAADVPSDVALLFQSYGWTATERMGEADVRMPDSLMTDAEDSPFQLYWMRAVVLSGDISCSVNRIAFYNLLWGMIFQSRFTMLPVNFLNSTDSRFFRQSGELYSATRTV
jgi:hypothetical protein